jgi:hypothetical protein
VAQPGAALPLRHDLPYGGEAGQKSREIHNL